MVRMEFEATKERKSKKLVVKDGAKTKIEAENTEREEEKRSKE